MAILQVRRIEGEHGKPSTYLYQLEGSSDQDVGPVERHYSVTVSPSVLEELCGELGDLVVRSYHTDGSDAFDHIARLQVPGGLLYRALFPVLEGYLADLVARLKDVGEPLLIRTNDPTVPWELLHDGEKFLGLRYALACQSIVETPVAAGRGLGPIGQALLINDPLADLPEAERETESLVSWLTREGASCTVLERSQATLMRVLSELASGSYDLLHYSGHVAVHEQTEEAALLLHGDKALDVRTIRGALSGEPSARGEAARGAAPPIVFVNACASAGGLSSLCSSFMATGSRVVVGTRFEVPEQAARQFAELFYTRLMSGMAAGSAMRESRELLSVALDAAWASFVLFGDPNVRLWPDEQARPVVPEQAAEEPPPEEQEEAAPADEAAPSAPIEDVQARLEERLAELLDPRASAIMAEAIRGAARGGLVTSVHLLVAFLRHDDSPMPESLAQIGVSADSLAEALSSLIEQAPEADAGEEIRLSATVEKVVEVAGDVAAAASRRRIAPQDLAGGFVRVGGGTAGDVLIRLGVFLDDLTPGGRPDLLEVQPPSLFDDDSDALLGRHLERSTAAALQAAAGIAGAQGQMISSYAAFLGFCAAGSRVLRAALLAQGEAGAEMTSLIPAEPPLVPGQRELRTADFSARTFNALEQALAAARAAGAPLVDDAAVLRELLREEGSSLRELLEARGVDADDLASALESPRGGDEPAT